MNRGNYLIKNTAIFALSNLGTKLVSLLLVPIYTSTLTTDQYGIVDLITTIITIAVPMVTFNIGEAVMRFSLDKDSESDKIASIGILFLVLSIILTVIIIPICSIYQKVSDYTFLVYLFCVSEGIFTIAYCFLRGREKLIDFAVSNIIVSIVSAVLNIIFLVIFNLGIRGYFYAFTIANFTASFYALYKSGMVSSIPKFNIDKSLLKEMLAYSIVLVPNSFMWWIMNASDRIMVTALIGASANGIYAVSYKIPSILSIFSRIFNQAWSYSAILEDDSRDRDDFNNNMLSVFTQFLIVVTGFFMVTIKPFLSIYVSDAYYFAWKYTPYLLIGFLFMSLGTFLSTSYTVNKDSKGFLFSGMAGAIINIVLNLILLPIMGISGAALATCISYFIVLLYRYFDTQKYLKYKLFSPTFIKGILILVMMGFSMYANFEWSVVLLIGEYLLLLLIVRPFFKWVLTVWRRVKGSRG